MVWVNYFSLRLLNKLFINPFPLLREQKLKKMKKVLSILAIAAFAVSFTACKKDYTCECTTKDGATVLGTTTATAKLKKSDADAWCGDYSVTAGTLVMTCDLK